MGKLTIEPIAGFSALKFKEEAQQRVQVELEGLTAVEQVRWIREHAEKGPLGDLIRKWRGYEERRSA